MTRQTRVLNFKALFAFWGTGTKRMELEVINAPTSDMEVIGASITGQTDLFWPGRGDKGYVIGSIMFSGVKDDLPGFIKEFSPKFGQVWRRISAAEIQHRRKTTLWK